VGSSDHQLTARPSRAWNRFGLQGTECRCPFHVGYTSDLDSRLESHRMGHAASYTSRRQPVDLVYSEHYPSLVDARMRENQRRPAVRAGRRLRRPERVRTSLASSSPSSRPDRLMAVVHLHNRCDTRIDREPRAAPHVGGPLPRRHAISGVLSDAEGGRGESERQHRAVLSIAPEPLPTSTRRLALTPQS
jgi:predicted GIY-YIG superfamily endonuclease